MLVAMTTEATLLLDKRCLIVLVVRWLARLVGVAIFLLMGLIAIGEGPPNPWGQPWAVNAQLHLMLALWIGLIVGWKWEGVGAALVLGGFALFSIIEGRFTGGIAWFWLLTGAGYLFCWIMDRRKGRCTPGARLSVSEPDSPDV
ncbi:MAG: hypothetical protein WBL15_05805 [Phycisphaerae bacterium]|nr:hypothetical protein [Phycisphaerae bacterium]HQE42735.1 hypothetical protein [Phycisphaerae bacterium]